MTHTTMKSFAEFLDILSDEVILQQEVSKAKSLKQVLKIAFNNGYFGLTIDEATHVVRQLIKEDKKREKARPKRNGSITYKRDTLTFPPMQTLSKGCGGLQYLSSEILQQVTDEQENKVPLN